MARTDAERLELYLTLRDLLDDALATGAPTIRYRIGNTEVQKEATTSYLAFVNETIAGLQAATNASQGPARNLVRFQR